MIILLKKQWKPTFSSTFELLSEGEICVRTVTITHLHDFEEALNGKDPCWPAGLYECSVDVGFGLFSLETGLIIYSLLLVWVNRLLRR